MAKKKLLSEAQVKRFMGLAGIKPLNEMAHYGKDKDDDMKEGYGMEEDLMEEEDEMKMDDKEPAMDMGDDEPKMDDKDVDVEMDEEDLAELKAALDTVQSVLSPLLDKAEDEEEMDMGDDDDMPAMEMDDEKEDEEEKDEPEMDMNEELNEVTMELTEEEIVNEVARRVAKRIVEAKRAHKKMNEALGRK